MRKFLPIVAILGVFFGSFLVAQAASVFITQQGGTGTSSPSGILYGDNGSSNHLNTVTVGSGCTFVGGTLSCPGTGGGGGSGTVSTSTHEIANSLPIWTSTSATPATLGQIIATTNGFILALVNGIPTWVATSSIQNLVIPLVVSNGGTGQSTFLSGQLIYGNGTAALSSVATSSLSAANATLSTTGTLGALVGGTASTFAINLANPNSWTALQQFANASSTLFSATYASSTQYYGANLAGCNSASNALTWAAGVFGCNTISGSGTVNAGLAGQMAYYAAGGTAVSGTTRVFQASSGNVGIGGTTTPSATLTVTATTTTGTQPIQIWTDATGVTGASISTTTAGTGGLSIGTSTGTGLLAIGNNGWNFYDNATTSKSGVGGINIQQGCYALLGTCITGTGTGTNYFTNAAANTYLNLGSRLQAANFDATSTTGTSTITANLTIGSGLNLAGRDPYLLISTTTPPYGYIQGDLIDLGGNDNRLFSINVFNAAQGNCAQSGYFANGDVPAVNSNYGTLMFKNTGWTGNSGNCAADSLPPPLENQFDLSLFNPTGNMDFGVASTSLGTAFNFNNGTNIIATIKAQTGSAGFGTTTPDAGLTVTQGTGKANGTPITDFNYTTATNVVAKAASIASSTVPQLYVSASSTPASAFSGHSAFISKGASATTTVDIGEIGDTTSHGCVNIQDASVPAVTNSFFMRAGVLVGENHPCL